MSSRFSRKRSKIKSKKRLKRSRKLDKSLKSFYCGDNDDLPDEYERRGSRYECMRKGVGVGMGIKEKQIYTKYNLSLRKRPRKEDEVEKERRLYRQERRPSRGSREDYERFVNLNYGLARRRAGSEDGVFVELSEMWKERKNIGRRTPQLSKRTKNTKRTTKTKKTKSKRSPKRKQTRSSKKSKSPRKRHSGSRRKRTFKSRLSHRKRNSKKKYKFIGF